MSDHNFDWDDIEEKALQAFDKVARELKVAYGETKIAELARGMGDMMQGLAQMRAQRQAEEQGRINKSPVSLGTKGKK
jgi:hypothetical protein